MTETAPRTLASLMQSVSPSWPADLLPHIRERIAAQDKTVVVLDDDPTGTQTVYDTTILTRWETSEIADVFREQTPLLYLLTNSRSLTASAANDLAVEAAKRLMDASRQTGRQFVVVSRSDSTLRGHYPDEVQTLAAALGAPRAVHVLIPAFIEGERYTIGDVHYVPQGGGLVPAAETPFARDAAFGYRNSDLKEWVEEKTGGHTTSASVRSITLETLRQGGPSAAASQLQSLRPGDVCIVNAAEYRDLEVATLALMEVEARETPIIYRTAASFVRVRAGLEPRGLLPPSELGMETDGWGLTVLGSYVELSTAQWRSLRSSGLAECVELSVPCLLDDGQREAEIGRATNQIDRCAEAGRDVAVATSRQLVTGSGATESLSIGQQVSDALTEVVRRLSCRPRYVLAKGGVTSSDTATRGLEIRRARVLGQILPGVPVWRAGAGSRFSGLPYFVFPGNVGDADSLVDLVRTLRSSG